MCNLSQGVLEKGMEKGMAAGRTEGEMKKAKETAFVLADRGMPVSDIAEIVKVSTKVVEEWLSGRVSSIAVDGLCQTAESVKTLLSAVSAAAASSR